MVRGEVGNLNYEGTDIYYMEAEVLGPLRHSRPARRRPSRSTGACAAVHGAVIDVTAGGCLSAPLALERLDGGYGRVTASGGVFDAGTLELAWLDGQRTTLSTQPLGPVDPLTVVSLDRIVTVPDQAVSVR